MPLQLQRVAVDPLAGPGRRRAEPLEPLFELAAAALEYPHPDLRLSQAEEGEVHTESVVLPGGRAGLPEQVVEPLLAVRGQSVDDLGAARAVGRPAGIRGGILGDQSLAEQVLQRRVEGSETKRAEGAEQ